jgi:hypothetical protein
MSMATLIIKTISIYIFYIILYYKCRGGGGHACKKTIEERNPDVISADSYSLVHCCNGHGHGHHR